MPDPPRTMAQAKALRVKLLDDKGIMGKEDFKAQIKAIQEEIRGKAPRGTRFDFTDAEEDYND